MTGYLATAGYLFPALRNVMLPLMERRGKQAKDEYREAQRRPLLSDLSGRDDSAIDDAHAGVIQR